MTPTEIAQRIKSLRPGNAVLLPHEPHKMSGNGCYSSPVEICPMRRRTRDAAVKIGRELQFTISHVELGTETFMAVTRRVKHLG